MGSRGRIPRTAKEEARRGNPRRQKRSENAQPNALDGDHLAEKPIETVTPAKPDWLSKDASAHWDRLLPIMLAADMVRAVDGDLLAEYCEELSIAIRCRKVLKTKGATIRHANGAQMPRPEVKQGRDAWKHALKMASELGLTPRARKTMSISITAAEPQSDQTSRKKAILGRRQAGEVAELVAARKRRANAQ